MRRLGLKKYWFGAGIAVVAVFAFACSRTSAKTGDLVSGDAASRVYVAPGSKDELYAFMSGGFSGQVPKLPDSWIKTLASGRSTAKLPTFETTSTPREPSRKAS